MGGGGGGEEGDVDKYYILMCLWSAFTVHPAHVLRESVDNCHHPFFVVVAAVLLVLGRQSYSRSPLRWLILHTRLQVTQTDQ